MAAVVYPKFKEALLDGSANTDLTTENIKVILVDLNDYTYSAAHDFLDDVPAGARVATTANLGSKTVTDGVFDAADTIFTAATGDPSEALIGYVDTGVEGTSHLVWFDDGSSGLPITPNGQDINVTWDSGANRIFAL